MQKISSEGRCLCQEIQFRVNGPVLGSAVCHCRDCQHICGGAPAYVIAVSKSSLEVVKGQPSRYANTAASGARRTRYFCGNCGSPLFADDANYPDVVTIKIGSLDDSSSFEPKALLWTASAPAWHMMDPNIIHFPMGPSNS